MKTILLLSCFFSAGIFQDRPVDFRLLYKLTGGTWVMQTKKGQLAEYWQKLNDNKLTNRSFKVSGADTTWLESVELTRNGRTITYLSLVKNENGGKAVPFTLTMSTPEKFIFENPTHDFPQRIIYHFVTPDSLHAWIEGKQNGKEGRSDFYYSRRR